MRRASILILLLIAFSMTAKTTTTKKPIDDVIHDYVIGFLQRNPTVNTYLGGTGLDPSLRAADGRLRDYSVAAIAKEDQWLRGLARALTSYDDQALTSQQRIDRDVALAQIRFQLHLHGARKYQQRSVDTYTDEPFRAIDFQLQGMPDDWSLVAKRLNDVPRYLETAQQQLRAGIAAKNTADFRMLFRNGLGTSEANAKYFDETFPKLAAAHPETIEASKKAAAAFRRFHDFVAKTFFDDLKKESGIKPQFAGDRYAFGETDYNWALKNNLRVDKTAQQLYDESWAVVDATRREMIGLARKIARGRGMEPAPTVDQSVRMLFDSFGRDIRGVPIPGAEIPRSDAELLGWYRDAAFRLVDYARKTKIFKVPDDYKLDVVETPPPLRAAIDGAAYYPAPPFKQSGVGRFYVTTSGTNDKEQLKANNRASLADLSAHEGFPGHDWHYKMMTQYRDQIAGVRWLTPGAVEDSSAMWEDSLAAEGWAHYAEALMAEAQPGAPQGAYTPEERLYQLQGKLYRDLRVRVDTGIHTGRMSYDDAVDLFSQVVDFLPGSCGDASSKAGDSKRASCTSAEAAIF